MKKTTEESTILAILELAGRISKSGNKYVEEIGLTTQQWVVLLYIRRDVNVPNIQERVNEDGALASEIAEALNVSRPNITNLVNTLVHKGYVEQFIDGADRRRKRLKLTAEGKQMLVRLDPIRREANLNFFDVFSKKEREQFLSLLQKALQRVEEVNTPPYASNA
jgi:DNA-binding MarR family transcriptional regulator